MILTLPVDTESAAYMFYTNLHEDVKLISNEYGEWDIDFKDDDWVNCTGFDSLVNACIIAIMTRLDEMDYVDLYTGFGCRIHELIKQNKNRNILYHMEIFITEVLTNMRRIERVNYVEITDSPNNQEYHYRVNFNVTCRADEDNEGEIIEESIQV